MEGKKKGMELQYRLKKAGYTLTRVAEELDVSVSMVSRALTGMIVSKRVMEHIEQIVKDVPVQ